MTHSGPSKAAEAIVGALLPSACREEVLGDLHERFASRLHYALDAALTIPLVVVSRIRRIADLQAVLLQCLAVYMSFLGATWLGDRALLGQEWGLMRLALPSAMAVLGMLLDDAYANPGLRSGLSLAWGPVAGVVFVLGSQGVLRITNSGLALPGWITLYGCGMSLLLSSALRMLFLPSQPEGVNVPAQPPGLRTHLGRFCWQDRLRYIGFGGGSDQMNRRTKIAIAAALVVGIAAALPVAMSRRAPGPLLTYTQFVDQVHGGQVESVVVIGGDSSAVVATLRTKDGKAARTVLPSNYTDALRAMEDRLVSVEIRDPSSEPRRLLVNATPFFLLLGVWVVLMVVRFPNWPKATPLR